MSLFVIVWFLIGAIFGGVLMRFWIQRKEEAELKIAQKQAEVILEEAKSKAEVLKKERDLEIKANFLKLKNQHDEKISERNRVINSKENALKKRESSLSQKESALDKKHKEIDGIRDKVTKQQELLNDRSLFLEQRIDEVNRQLEVVANMSAEQARQKLMENLRQEAQVKALVVEQEILEETRKNAGKEARKIIVNTIQRVASEQVIENVVTTFPLDNDEIKGQIIGREGRNIRALEHATGVDLMIDDTPGAIVLSCFDPLRREIARLSLQRLVSDGRIHPARIEEVVEKTRQQIEERVMELGERTTMEMGIHGMHRELIRYVGRMYYRSSYRQNLLAHSREVANLSAMMAAEIGVNPKLAKRAGLLHDIGKVPDTESELSHDILGMQLCEKYGEAPAIVNAVGAHHDKIEMQYVISPIIQACDTISASRPGARCEIAQQYLQRIKDLESLALGHNGVEKAYAIQAGRELRVIVEAERVDDVKANQLAFQITDQIKNQITYPGQIKVTVIRETRAVAIAK